METKTKVYYDDTSADKPSNENTYRVHHSPLCVTIHPSDIPSKSTLSKLIAIQKNSESCCDDEQPDPQWVEGDMLWGKVRGYPYWPCMVAKDPFSRLFCRGAGGQRPSYHVQFFGASAERGWVNEASLLPFLGREHFLDIVQYGLEEPGSSCKSPESFQISPDWFPVWSLAVSEADSAFKLSREERKSQYTFKYVIQRGTEQRPMEKLLESIWRRSAQYVGEGDDCSELSSDEEDFFNLRDRKWKQRTWYDSDDFYSSEEDTSSNDSKPSRGHIIITVREGSLEVFITKTSHFIKVDHPDWTQEEIEEYLRQQWSLMSSSQRACYVTRHEKPARIVAKRIGRRREVDDFELIDPYDLDLEILKLSSKSATDVSYKVICDLCFRGGSSDVIQCDRKCGKRCHVTCGQMDSGTLLCPDCAQGKLKCFICKKGQGHLRECSNVDCLHHYHLKCVKNHLRFVGSQTKCEALCEPTDHKFVCPLHKCATCGKGEQEKTDSSQDGLNLLKCSLCPVAYHISDFCIPAGSEVNLATSWLRCPTHFVPDKKNSQHTGAHVKKCMRCGKGDDLTLCITCPMAYHWTCITTTVTETTAGCAPDTVKNLNQDTQPKSDTLPNHDMSVLSLEDLLSEAQSYHSKKRKTKKKQTTGQKGKAEVKQDKKKKIKKGLSDHKNWQCESCKQGKQPLYGDIVWVRLGNYRWWPGEICHPSHVPPKVKSRVHQVGEFPIHFFGSHDYAWLHKGRVYPFQQENYDLQDSNSDPLSELFIQGVREATAALRLCDRTRDRWAKDREKEEGWMCKNEHVDE